MRLQDAKRLAKEGHEEYKKGYELRLIAHSNRELFTIRNLLQHIGVSAGRAYYQARHYRQPIYGLEQVTRFLSLVRPYLQGKSSKARQRMPMKRARRRKRGSKD